MQRIEVIPGAQTRRPITCSRCKKVGHNKASCKDGVGEVPIDPYADMPELLPDDYDSDAEEEWELPALQPLVPGAAVPPIDQENGSEDEEAYLDPTLALELAILPPGPNYFEQLITEENWKYFEVPPLPMRNTRGRGSVS